MLIRQLTPAAPELPKKRVSKSVLMDHSHAVTALHRSPVCLSLHPNPTREIYSTADRRGERHTHTAESAAVTARQGLSLGLGGSDIKNIKSCCRET